ncbi:MAG: tail fiber domain-containing protein, partial [Bacteroidota bacterium]
GGDFYSTNAPFNVGARGTATASEGYGIGLWGTVSDGNNGIGVKAEADADQVSIGVDVNSQSGNTANYGVKSNVNPVSGATNIGMYSYVAAGTSPGSIAVYGDIGCSCTIGIGTAPDYAGYFNGEVYSTSMFSGSDANLKHNIEPLSDPMIVLNQIEPKSYEFNQNNNESMYLPQSIHFGVIAQDLEIILPQLVKESVHPARYDSVGNVVQPAVNFKAVNYIELIPFLVAAMKQMDSTNQSLQTQINDLRNTIDGCCGASRLGQSHPETHTNEITLSSESIILNQNDPNPFAEKTTISYFIPTEVSKAEIIFYNNNGNVLKSMVINDRGNGSVLVYASNLSSGIYTYGLIADGKLIDTKKMVCTK